MKIPASAGLHHFKLNLPLLKNHLELISKHHQARHIYLSECGKKKD